MINLQFRSPMAIVKANQLIESSYRLGSREQFFILFVISKLDSVGDEKFPSFKVHYNDIVKILNFDGKRRVANTSDVFKIMRNLNSSPIQFEDEEIREESVWISSLRENKKEGTFSFTFPETLKPFLIQLKEKFTKYNIKNIVHLNSHALRMYEILKRYEYENEKRKEGIVLEVDKLKKWLGIEDKYPEYFEFKRCILIKAQKELKKYTDIAFTFETARKSGRKIVALRFFITSNTPTKQTKALDKLQSITIGGGGAKSTKTKKGFDDAIVVKEDSKTHKQKLVELSWAETEAYLFLVDKGINKAFIVDKILVHPNVKYEPLQGFEDMYIKVVWNFFKKKTNSDNLAPTFVTWWKKGRLTEAGLHAKHLEDVVKLKSQLSGDKRSLRLAAKNMTLDEFKQHQTNMDKPKVQSELIKDFASKMGMPKDKVKGKVFDFKRFQADYPNVYQDIYDKAVAGFEASYLEMGKTFDRNKFSKTIQNNVEAKCKEWFLKKNSIK